VDFSQLAFAGWLSHYFAALAKYGPCPIHRQSFKGVGEGK